MTNEQLRQAQARLEQLDTMTVDEIGAQYQNLAVAEKIPRLMMYLDIGYLCGRIELLKRELAQLQERHDAAMTVAATLMHKDGPKP